MHSIIVSTVRWSPQVASTLAGLSEFTDPKTRLVISDCSGEPEKVAFIRELAGRSRNVIAAFRPERVPLYRDVASTIQRRCQQDEFVSIVADDDVVTHDYIKHSETVLSANTDAVCSYGRYVIAQTSGKTFIDSRSVLASSAGQRIEECFDPNQFNTMFFATFRRRALQPWAVFTENHPAAGAFFDFIHCLSLMAQVTIIAHERGHYLWTGENWDTPDENLRSRARHYRSMGLPEQFASFFDLHFAVECINFLGSQAAPPTAPRTAQIMQVVWNRCFSRFRTAVDINPNLYTNLLAASATARAGLDALLTSPQLTHREIVNHMAAIIAVFSEPVAQRYASFFSAGR